MVDVSDDTKVVSRRAEVTGVVRRRRSCDEFRKGMDGLAALVKLPRKALRQSEVDLLGWH
jgi:transcriptional regulator NrdR family protein